MDEHPTAEPTRILQFDPQSDLIFSSPKWIMELSDIEISAQVGTSPMAVSDAFPLFSTKVIDQMRREVLQDEVQQKFRYNNDCQLRGMAPE